jgi:hypothetical protein
MKFFAFFAIITCKLKDAGNEKVIKRITAVF